jgi:CCR4-NOT transcription complex subunit 3
MHAKGRHRLREKIRTSMGNAEVKERQRSLEAARRRIEENMEIYKSWEKETKTKAFSKEGLATAKVVSICYAGRQEDRREGEDACLA